MTNIHLVFDMSSIFYKKTFIGSFIQNYPSWFSLPIIHFPKVLQQWNCLSKGFSLGCEIRHSYAGYLDCYFFLV